MTFFTLSGGIAAVGITLATAAHAQEHGKVEYDLTMESEILGKDVEYTIYTPPGFDTDGRTYPVIYLMHGGGDGDNSDWYRFGQADDLFDAMIGSGAVPPFIAVTPDGRRDDTLEYNTYYMNDADGAVRWEDMFVEEFVPFVEETYPVIASEDARAIAGLSMGGYAALAYAMKYPDMFAAAVGLSPAVRTDEQIATLDQAGYDRRYGKAWGVGLEGEARLNEAYRANSVFDLADAASPEDIAATKLYIDTGADDVFFDGSVLLHQMLRSEGETERTLASDHRFMIREGGHTWDYWRSGLPEAIRFIGGVFGK
ncbi:enterochelin esterase-like enzyme [Palleronia aestuarii]|uniref:Enterochelin esterase-like enzyme n=1 Tax=Palleronia aestuarii TaxID=568105 RepID=A0A2W7NCB3_9RHOB|nr:alpha/beta hydrolase-fold protein [Palleronia aestuarii]PZX14374.1 enterochelin esterase-like enzyme [Palleronia aestuarii]